MDHIKISNFMEYFLYLNHLSIFLRNYFIFKKGIGLEEIEMNQGF